MTDTLNENEEVRTGYRTPETDAIVKQFEHLLPNWLANEMAAVARRLEHERDEARFDLAFSRDLYRLQESQLDELRNQLAESRKDCQMWKSEHSALVKALFEIADMADDDDPYFALDSIQDLLKKLGL